MIENSPKFPGGFTVLMAVYVKDSVELFERAVVSVFNNSLMPDYFILVVDGPVTVELDFLISYLTNIHKIELIRLPSNIGLANALNVGLEYVRTEWVLRADADDYNLPHRFEVQAKAVNLFSNCIELIGGAIQEVELGGNLLAVRRTVEKHDDIRRYVRFRNPFNHMTVAYKAKFVLRCGGYPNISFKEDYALWALMIASGARVCNLSDILVNATAGKEMYRRRGGWGYIYSDIRLQRFLVKIGVKSFIFAIISALIGCVFSLMPNILRGWFYVRVLRKSC